MIPEKIKYIYEIESSIDLDEIIDSLTEEFNLKDGILEYFSHSKDDLIKENLPINDLKSKAIEVSNNDEYPSIVFPNFEIIVEEDRIEIISKIKLKLNNIDVDNIIEKQKNLSKIEKNSIDVLESRFQNLLKGIDTKKYKYASENQKQTTIRTIKSFIKERLSDNAIDKKSDIWRIIIDIDSLDFDDINEIKIIYSRLYNLNDTKRSTYYKQVGRENK